MLESLKKEFLNLKNQEKARILQGFFKTGKGEYGEGDIFLGIVVPKQRALVKKYWNLLDLGDIQELLNSSIHEHRLTALLMLVKQYEKASGKKKSAIFNFYLLNTRNINNWDLVDLSAPNIVGSHLLDKDRKILYNLANSSHLWEKRISILATSAFIRNKDFEDTIKISEILLKDKHDLIHKAVGWMLREIGKRNLQVLETFLKKHHKTMPRTMLRYAIEKLPEKTRKAYLDGTA
ncbi:MAG: DNA alkylation repair protein [archaeon]|jgi:3-methyladenine DNA glycosylase AlkD|nr:DNA alkylation repair protein [archaeon]